MEKSIFTREYEILLELLRELRLAANVTQVELAELIDENQVFVSRFERGETRLDIIQVRTICQALGSSLPTMVRSLEKQLE